jgi:hypothetical protein
LAVANRYNGVTSNIKSSIYRFSLATGQFVLFQQLDTHGAHDLATFVIDFVSYLTVANYFDDSTHKIKSQIYRYDSALGLFVLFQQIDVSGAHSCVYFVQPILRFWFLQVLPTTLVTTSSQMCFGLIMFLGNFCCFNSWPQMARLFGSTF